MGALMGIEIISILGVSLSLLAAVTGALYMRVVGTLDHVADTLEEVSQMVAVHEQKHSDTDRRITRIEGVRA